MQTPQFTADSHWLEELLQRLPGAGVAVIGDLCLDAYWVLDPESRLVSLETGLPVHMVRGQRYSPGGAGNVAANLAALGVGRVRLVGLVGPDLFGDELLRQLAERNVGGSGVLRGPPGWQTPVYVKPLRGNDELNRFDLGALNPSATECWEEALRRFDTAAAECPVAIINQQVTGGWSENLVAGLGELIARHPATLFLVDSRDHAGGFPGAALKLNLTEATRLLQVSPEVGADPTHALADALAARQARPVMVTRGDRGLVLADGRGIVDVPGIDLPGAVDPVGAGDTALAALAAALACGAASLEAATFANLAAAVTTRQARMTGVATPQSLRQIGPAPDYVHAPRLAAEPHRARHASGTDIELVTEHRPAARIRHAIFDHDGTISTLRQGWEAIMEPLMTRAILGSRFGRVDETAQARVVATVREFIDRTTGIQTLAQMKGLADLVREFGFVPAAEVLDEHGYKAIYNEQLLQLVRQRLARLERGELLPGDWEIKNARVLLERLHAAGVTLYLASGTDEADVIREARAMGYAHLFTGGIHGAVGDLRIEAKRIVIERIIQAGGLGGEELVVIGDGPVEIREGCRRGAFTVGVASDEVRRHGLDHRKRARLIRAGADVVVPDFAQLDALLGLLEPTPTK